MFTHGTTVFQTYSRGTPGYEIALLEQLLALLSQVDLGPHDHSQELLTHHARQRIAALKAEMMQAGTGDACAETQFK